MPNTHPQSGPESIWQQDMRSPVAVDEVPGYLNQGPDQLYYVLHRPRSPRIGQVVMAGPFASERHRSYVSWVRWARHLAANGLEVLRFDYRGIGESTGDFTKMTFTEWLDDLHLCADWLRARGEEGCPLVLHGWRLGALLAAHAFERGMGDALLLWSPPPSAREMLREALRQRLFDDYAQNGNGARKTRDDYIAEMEAGSLVEVDGYEWSRRLWEQAAELGLDLAHQGAESAGSSAGRPWKIVRLNVTVGPLALRRGEHPRGLNPFLGELFDSNLEWIRQCVTGREGPRAADSAG